MRASAAANRRSARCGWRAAACCNSLPQYAVVMQSRSRKKKSVRDFNQIARSIVDQATGETAATPAKKSAAKPPQPINKQDAADRDRADLEGMGQPQGQASK